MTKTQTTETQIRKAYTVLSSAGAQWVLITDIRNMIDATTEDIDAALLRMERLPGVHLAPEADQKQLTAEDRDAAVRLGGADQHLLAITG